MRYLGKQDKIWAKIFCIPKNMRSRTLMNRGVHEGAIWSNAFRHPGAFQVLDYHATSTWGVHSRAGCTNSLSSGYVRFWFHCRPLRRSITHALHLLGKQRSDSRGTFQDEGGRARLPHCYLGCHPNGRRCQGCEGNGPRQCSSTFLSSWNPWYTFALSWNPH